MGGNLSDQKVGLAGSLGDALRISAWRLGLAAGQKPRGRPAATGRTAMAEPDRLKHVGWSRDWVSVDQLLLAQGLDGETVLFCRTAGLFGLAGQLPGGGDGHGRASGIDPAGWRGWGGWRVASGWPEWSVSPYFRHAGRSPVVNVGKP